MLRQRLGNWQSDLRSESQCGCRKEKWLIRKNRDNTPGNSCMWSWVRAQPDQERGTRDRNGSPSTRGSSFECSIQEEDAIHSWQSFPALGSRYRWEVFPKRLDSQAIGLALQHEPQGRRPESISREAFPAGKLSIKKWVTGEDWADSRSGSPVLVIRFQGRLWWPLKTHTLWYSWRREGKGCGVGPG